MPLSLSIPKEEKKPTVEQEIVWFGVDVEALHVDMVINDKDEDGNLNNSRRVRSPLVADGSPRFAQTIYDELKAFLYQIADEDGHVGEGAIT